MRRIIFFLLALSFATAFPASALEPRVEVRLEAPSQTVTAGEPFQIGFTLKQASNNVDINLEDVPIPGLEPFRSLGSSASTQVQMANGVSAVVSTSLKNLVADRPGTYQVGPVGLRFRLSGSTSTFDAVSNALTITVQPKLTATSEDISTASGALPNLPPWAKALGAGGVVGLFCAGIIVLMERKGQLTRIASKVRDGRDRLNPFHRPAVLAKDGSGPDQTALRITVPFVSHPEFFSLARWAVIKHLEANGVIAGARTTNDLIAMIEASDVPHRKDLIDILRRCDRARFAKSSEDAVMIHDMLINIIQPS